MIGHPFAREGYTRAFQACTAARMPEHRAAAFWAQLARAVGPVVEKARCVTALATLDGTRMALTLDVGQELVRVTIATEPAL